MIVLARIISNIDGGWCGMHVGGGRRSSFLSRRFKIAVHGHQPAHTKGNAGIGHTIRFKGKLVCEELLWATFKTQNLKMMVGDNIAANNDVNQRVNLSGKDLALVSRWAKYEAFNYCKFLYKGKAELALTGHLYKRFVDHCDKDLVGVSLADPEPTRRMYRETIWLTANERNLVSKGLAIKRSGVYTVMNNRFMGKCSRVLVLDEVMVILTFHFVQTQ
jgi:hypothetical protein